MKIKRLKGIECLQAKDLWKKVFSEDTEAFTEYYFQNKAPLNTGFVLEKEGRIKSMLYLTPENMRIGKKQFPSSYIVGVATNKTDRHQGHMTTLLKEAARWMYEKRQPIAFLMPANPAIYAPFGFRFIYERPVWKADTLQKGSLEKLTEENWQEAADFAEKLLMEREVLHIERNREYFALLDKEVRAQNGCIYSHRSSDRMDGLCVYTQEEGEADIQEILAEADIEKEMALREEKTKPVIMARIMNLCEVLALFHTEEAFEVTLQVTDTFLPENSGFYRWKGGPGGSSAEKTDAQQCDFCTSMEKLQEYLFSMLFSAVWIHEIV